MVTMNYAKVLHVTLTEFHVENDVENPCIVTVTFALNHAILENAKLNVTKLVKKFVLITPVDILVMPLVTEIYLVHLRIRIHVWKKSN